MSATQLNGTRFQIAWTTNESATSKVTLSPGGESSNNTLVTNHSMTFRGSNGVSYEYYVTSSDAAGNQATAGPFQYQN